MTHHTSDIHHLLRRTPFSRTDVDKRRLGPMALGMRERAARQDAYVAPAKSDYFAY